MIKNLNTVDLRNIGVAKNQLHALLFTLTATYIKMAADTDSLLYIMLDVLQTHLSAMIAVSYTHLDVYKRQGEYRQSRDSKTIY